MVAGADWPWTSVTEVPGCPADRVSLGPGGSRWVVSCPSGGSGRHWLENNLWASVSRARGNDPNVVDRG